jgi:hypothetical protein
MWARSTYAGCEEVPHGPIHGQETPMRRTYRKPQLTKLGLIRTLTQMSF